MSEPSTNGLKRKLPVAVFGTAVTVAPFFFPQWINVLAETYGFVPPVEEVEITDNGNTAGRAVLKTCITGDNGNSNDPGNRAFQADCNIIAGGLFGGDKVNAEHALNQIAADQVFSQNNISQRHLRAGIAVVSSRLSRLRLAAAERNSAEGLAYSLRQDTGGAAGDIQAGRLGGFFNLKYRFGDEDATLNQAGYDLDGWGFSAGADYRLNDNMFVGGVFNFASDDIEYDANRGDMDVSSIGLSAYGGYTLANGVFIDGLIGYTSNDYDMQRVIRYNVNGNVANQVASSDTDGGQFNITLGIGKTYDMSGFSVSPEVRLEYIRNEVDGFTESMSNPGGVGGSMAQIVDDTTYKSFTSRFGVQLAKAISTSTGVFVPQLRLAWVHEFETDAILVNTRYLNDINAGSNAFLIVGDSQDSDYFDLGLSVTGQFRDGVSGFVSYDTLLGLNNVSIGTISAGVRMEF